LKIEKIVYPGRSMALDQGKVVFTDRGLPGETVEVEVVRDRKSFAEGRTVRIVEPVPLRVEPRCAHYLACSPYQEMSYDLQLAVKKTQVEEILSRELKVPFSDIPIIPSPEIWGYRNRIRLRVVRDGGRVSFAYHEPGEQAVFVPVDACYLVPDRVNALVAELRMFIEKEEWEAAAEIEIRDSRSRGKSLIVFHLESAARLEEMAGKLTGLHLRHPVTGIVGLIRDGHKVREESLGGAARIDETIHDVYYRIGPRSFFQVNVPILERVFDDLAAALDGFEDASIADLYCGLGTFGIFLARRVREVFGVEAEAENVRWLKKNMQLNRVGNFTVCEGTSEAWLPWVLEREPGAIILDPPRRGVDPGMLEALAADPAPRLLYLSCNPTTLARDLKILAPAYTIADLRIYDFFPHTPHIETLAVLSKR
jgi:23S rRNA (uracil1939-C5)-methyltransferase